MLNSSRAELTSAAVEPLNDLIFTTPIFVPLLVVTIDERTPWIATLARVTRRSIPDLSLPRATTSPTLVPGVPRRRDATSSIESPADLLGRVKSIKLKFSQHC